MNVSYSEGYVLMEDVATLWGALNVTAIMVMLWTTWALTALVNGKCLFYLRIMSINKSNKTVGFLTEKVCVKL